jgi:hypothetical protein
MLILINGRMEFFQPIRMTYLLALRITGNADATLPDP